MPIFWKWRKSKFIFKICWYDCFANINFQGLSNYKLSSISEDEYKNTENLNSININNLVKKVNDIEKEESLFTQSELDKYILSIINEESKLIELDNTVSKFVISGKTNKAMSNNLSGKLSLSDTNEKEFNCEVDAKDKDKASLLYNVNISKYAEEFQKEKFKIEEEKIIGESNNIYFEGIKDVELFSKKIKINSENPNSENNNDNNNNTNPQTQIPKLNLFKRSNFYKIIKIKYKYLLNYFIKYDQKFDDQIQRNWFDF